jgi:hypothetical protein
MDKLAIRLDRRGLVIRFSEALRERFHVRIGTGISVV